MEESTIRQLWIFCLWYAGISATVALGFFGWLASLSNRIAVKENIREDLDDMANDLKAIKIALIGDFEKKGLVTKMFDLENRINDMEDEEKKKPLHKGGRDA